jgi:hypothetical protein
MKLKNTLFNLLEKTKITLWGTKQLIVATPKETAAIALAIFLQGIIPACSLFIVQKTINWILAPEALLFPLVLVIAWGGILIVSTVIDPIVSILCIHLNEPLA